MSLDQGHGLPLIGGGQNAGVMVVNTDRIA